MLSKKEELSEAESERVEKLQALVEQQEEAVQRAMGGGMNMMGGLAEYAVPVGSITIKYFIEVLPVGECY